LGTSIAFKHKKVGLYQLDLLMLHPPTKPAVVIKSLGFSLFSFLKVPALIF
jgi:hypothetical protein